MNSLNSLDLIHLPVDPRLISAGHSGQRLFLGEPMLSGKVCLNDIKTGFYGDYSDIRAGNILYYTDDDLAKPFISYAGVFPPTAFVEYEDYIDPNGILKPHYKRLPNSCELDGKCTYGCRESIEPGCLTFVRDTNRARAEFMALNMWRRNQETGFKM